MTNDSDIQHSFFNRYPGPFCVSPGSDGVDATFDINCETTGQFLTATHYWEDREQAKLIASDIAEALNLARENAA